MHSNYNSPIEVDIINIVGLNKLGLYIVRWCKCRLLSIISAESPTGDMISKTDKREKSKIIPDGLLCFL